VLLWLHLEDPRDLTMSLAPRAMTWSKEVELPLRHLGSPRLHPLTTTHYSLLVVHPSNFQLTKP